ncbi:MAG TPA: hypothetical protein VIZ69_07865, partial [Thermoanaerobaculia bacterium]
RIVPAVTSEVRLMQAHEKFYGRSLAPAFGTILKRLDRSARAPKASRTAERPAAPPPPALQPAEADETPEEPAIPFLVSAASPPRSIAIDGGPSPDSLPDPFSDGYSLTDFVADALAFGAPARELFEGRAPEAMFARTRGEQKPRDGAPLAPGEDLDDTRPSPRRGAKR